MSKGSYTSFKGGKRSKNISPSVPPKKSKTVLPKPNLPKRGMGRKVKIEKTTAGK